jgi:hypothetical protein
MASIEIVSQTFEAAVLSELLDKKSSEAPFDPPRIVKEVTVREFRESLFASFHLSEKLLERILVGPKNACDEKLGFLIDRDNVLGLAKNRRPVLCSPEKCTLDDQGFVII